MSKKICFITTVSFTMDAFILDFAKYLKEKEDYDITLMCNPDQYLKLKFLQIYVLYQWKLKGIRF